MMRPKAYGQIFQDVSNLNSGPSGARLLPHGLKTTDFCSFIVQDSSHAAWGVAPQPLSRIYRSNKTVDVFEVTDKTVVGFANYDVMLVAAHSILDVGPITDRTRKPFQIFRPRNVRVGRAAYRSLHTGVQFDRGGGGLAQIDVLLTHRMQTQNVMVFSSPISDPFDPASGGSVVRVWWDKVGVANPLTQVMLHAVRADGLNFGPETMPELLYDVMVLSVPAVGHSIVFHNNRNYPILGGPPPLSKRPDYRTAAHNVMLATNPAVEHNDRKVASIALFSQTQLPAGGPPTSGETYIKNRAGVVPNRQISIDFATPTSTRGDILVLSPHSIFTLSRVVGPVGPVPV